jgi:hypothetical protein
MLQILDTPPYTLAHLQGDRYTCSKAGGAAG